MSTNLKYSLPFNMGAFFKPYFVVTKLSVGLSDLKSQYNPRRFKYWQSLHKGPPDRVLDMAYSPHVKFLRQYMANSDIMNNGYKETAYYRMQVLYSKNNRSIISKMEKFIDLFESIRQNGFKGYIQILEKPMFANPFNDSFEIYEGHHRVACCHVLDYPAVPAEVIRLKSGDVRI